MPCSDHPPFRTRNGNLQLAGTNLPAISEYLDKTAIEVPGVVLRTQVTMRELERLIEAMLRHWLWRKYVNQTNRPPLRPLSVTVVRKRKPVKVFRSPGDSTR